MWGARWLLVAGLSGMLAVASAGQGPSKRKAPRRNLCPGQLCQGKGGGELPTPFEALNRTVELADGERYLLTGRVLLDSRGLPFLEIDLEAQPWLASARRRANPHYPLAGPVSYWRKLEGRYVKMACEARGRIVYVDSLPRYHIFLEPVAGVDTLN